MADRHINPMLTNNNQQQSRGPSGLPLINHLLQHTLRSLCHSSDPHWVYSVFWRILPRNYPPPKWDSQTGPFDRSKGNKRNWILMWEDGYCDFAACCKDSGSVVKEERREQNNTVICHANGGDHRHHHAEEVQDHSPTSCCSLQPELFFKMSHDVYNYGEGLMGKVAADNSHRWIYRDPSDQDVAYVSPWQGSLDSHPHTWEAQFKAGIQTIAVIAVGEGLLQLGSTLKIMEDLNFVIMLQRKFNYLQSIPGVFAPHPMAEVLRMNGLPSPSMMYQCNSPSIESKLNNNVMGVGVGNLYGAKNSYLGVKRPLEGSGDTCNEDYTKAANILLSELNPSLSLIPKLAHNDINEYCVPSSNHVLPSMSSLQALLSKLPAVTSSTVNQCEISAKPGPAMPSKLARGSSTAGDGATSPPVVVMKREDNKSSSNNNLMKIADSWPPDATLIDSLLG